MKKLSMLLALVMLVLSFGSFAVAEGPIELTFWHSMGSRNGDAINAIVAAFNASQDKIVVTAEYQGSYDEAFAKLKSTPEGERPDVMQIYEVGSLWMKHSTHFIPVQQYIDADEGFDISQLQDNIQAYYTFDDVLYSVPFNSSVPALSYNKEAIEKAGVDPASLSTIEGVLAAAQKIVESGVCKYGACWDNDAWLFEQYIAMQDAFYSNNENGRAGVSTAVEFDSNGSGLNLLNIWAEFARSPYTVTYGSGGSGTAEAKKELSAGNVAMLISTCGNFRDLQDAASFTVAQTKLPKLDGNEPHHVSIGGASLWILNNGEATQGDAAWEFIKFCASPEMMAQWTYSTGYLPVSKAAETQEIYLKYLEENPGFAQIMDELHEAEADDAGAVLGVTAKLRSIIQNEIQLLINDEAYTAEEALESIVSQANDEIEMFNISNGLA